MMLITGSSRTKINRENYPHDVMKPPKRVFKKRATKSKGKPMTRDWGSWSGSRFLESKRFQLSQCRKDKVPTSALAVHTIYIQGIPYAGLENCRPRLCADLFALCTGTEQSELDAPREASPGVYGLAPLRNYFANS